MFSYSFTYTAQTPASGFDIVGSSLAELYSHLNHSFASESNGPFALSSQKTDSEGSGKSYAP